MKNKNISPFVGGRGHQVDLRTRLYSGTIRMPDGCLLSTRKRPTSGGHAQIRVNGRLRPLHRVAYEEAFGPIPKCPIHLRPYPGCLSCLVIRHTCDRPLCIESTHLLLGTQCDNIADRVERGRSRGRVTAAERARIRELLLAGVSQAEIATILNRYPSTIDRHARALGLSSRRRVRQALESNTTEAV